MKKIYTLKAFFGSRAELARRLKLNNPETLRKWELTGRIPEWRQADVDRLYRRFIK